MKSQLLNLGIALCALGVAESAHALTSHWAYITPATCSPATPSNFTGNDNGYVYMLNVSTLLCPIALPQGAIIHHARVYANPNGVANTLSFDIRSKNYNDPTHSAPSSAVWSNGSNTQVGWFYSAQPLNIGVDNENNSYYLRVNSTYTNNYTILFLIEIAYQTNP